MSWNKKRMLRQLSFDTSTSDVHVALFENERCVAQNVVVARAESSETSRQEACTMLVPSIEELLGSCSWTRSDIDCVTVGTGPGSFTGSRTAVVTARAICQALKLPLYPVSLLESFAADLAGEFAIVMFSNRDHYFLGQMRQDKLALSYASRAELEAAALSLPVVYADERTTADLSGNGAGAGEVRAEVRRLPKVTNIAAAQGRLAFNRLSKVRSICEKLIDVDQNLTCRKEVRLELMSLYPYNIVTPTYLRAPSVTLKKSNV